MDDDATVSAPTWTGCGVAAPGLGPLRADSAGDGRAEPCTDPAGRIAVAEPRDQRMPGVEG